TRAALRAGYAGRSRFLEETRAWENGPVVGLSYLSSAGLHLDIAAMFGSSSSLVLAEQRARLSQHPLTVAAGHAWRPAVSGLSWVTLQGTVTANWVSRETRNVEAGLVATEGDPRFVWAVGSRAGVATPVWGRL